LNPQEKQKDSIERISSEGNVLKLVLGYLSELGLSSENISVEHRTITIPVFRNVKITINGKSKPRASGRIDILVRNDTRENLFVIETKKPSESIDPAKVQALSYARLLLAPFVVVTNLKETNAQYFNFNFSPQRTYPSIIKRLETMCKQFNRPFVIFIDAIDECYIQNFPAIINNFLKQLKGRNFKVILSAKTYEVSRKFFNMYHSTIAIYPRNVNWKSHVLHPERMS
jgi:hypothetical protein